MIAELTQDLVNKLDSVTELTGKVGTQLGGTDTDAAMVEAPIPFAWVIFNNIVPLENTAHNGRKYAVNQVEFVVILAIDYGLDQETDFISDQLSLIDKAVGAVHASTEVTYSGLWEFTGCSLHTVYPNRLIYQLGFSANGHYTF